jgi:hypothetical protein
VIEAAGLRANLATVTGEALSRGRVAEAVDDDAPLAARNVLLAGTAIVAGEGRAVVYATGMVQGVGADCPELSGYALIAGVRAADNQWIRRDTLANVLDSVVVCPQWVTAR